jgi:thiol-disulfide isomerase/thioredoxin
MKLFTFLALSLLFSGCVIKEQSVQPNATAIKPTAKTVAKRKATPVLTKIQPTPTLATPTAKEQASAMSLKTLNGSIIKVNASGYNMEFLSPKYRGKNVMFFLFGYDCPHCKVEMPTIKELSLNPNLKIIGIHAKSMIGDPALKNFIRNKGLNFDILSFSDDIKMIRFLKDNDFYDGNVPCNVLVHKDGTVETVTVANVLGKL